MGDIMSGPNSPLAKAFEMSGWHIPTVDLLSGEEHDLSKPDNQEAIRRYLKQADFTWAATDVLAGHTSGRFHGSTQMAR